MFDFEITARCVYVLKLEGDFFYVGKIETALLENLLRCHPGEKGAIWTSIHKPIQILEVISAGNCSGSEVRGLHNDITLQYMAIHGWRNVRGGDYNVIDDLQLYYNLKKLQDQQQLSFTLDTLEDERGEQRYLVQERSYRFQEFDTRVQTRIKASIKSWFKKNTDMATCHSLEGLNIEELSEEWFAKNIARYGLTEASLPDIRAQFLQIKEVTVKRLTLLEGAEVKG